MKKRYWFLPLYLPFLLLAVIGIPTAILNYTGMCVSEGKWLSDEELAVRSIERLNNNLFRSNQNESKNWTLPSKEEIAAYVSQNPDCCVVSRDRNYIRTHNLIPKYASEGIETPDYKYQFLGLYRGFVFVKGAPLDTTHSNGQRMSKGTLDNIDNCGNTYFSILDKSIFNFQPEN
jgi:hypothetical protein